MNEGLGAALCGGGRVHGVRERIGAGCVQDVIILLHGPRPLQPLTHHRKRQPDQTCTQTLHFFKRVQLPIPHFTESLGDIENPHLDKVRGFVFEGEDIIKELDTPTINTDANLK